MYRYILWMVAKSCITNRMVFQPKQNNGILSTYQLVIRISLAHPPYTSRREAKIWQKIWHLWPTQRFARPGIGAEESRRAVVHADDFLHSWMAGAMACGVDLFLLTLCGYMTIVIGEVLCIHNYIYMYVCIHTYIHIDII